MAEFTTVNEDLVHVLPDNIPRELSHATDNACNQVVIFAVDVGALIEPLAVSWHAVKISRFKPGSNVLIIGAGPVSVLQAVRHPISLTYRTDRAAPAEDTEVRFASSSVELTGR